MLEVPMQFCEHGLAADYCAMCARDILERQRLIAELEEQVAALRAERDALLAAKNESEESPAVLTYDAIHRGVY